MRTRHEGKAGDGLSDLSWRSTLGNQQYSLIPEWVGGETDSPPLKRESALQHITTHSPNLSLPENLEGDGTVKERVLFRGFVGRLVLFPLTPAVINVT